MFDVVGTRGELGAVRFCQFGRVRANVTPTMVRGGLEKSSSVLGGFGVPGKCGVVRNGLFCTARVFGLLGSSLK